MTDSFLSLHSVSAMGKAILILSHLPRTLQLGVGKLLRQQSIVPKALHEPGRRISPNTMMAQCCLFKFWLCFTSDHPAEGATANHRYLISHDCDPNIPMSVDKLLPVSDKGGKKRQVKPSRREEKYYKAPSFIHPRALSTWKFCKDR